MSEASTTVAERETMMHALGSSHGSIGWRNYYCAAEGGDPQLESLVERGLMSRGHTINAGKSQYYSVTDEGIKALGYDPSILSKPKKVRVR